MAQIQNPSFLAKYRKALSKHISQFDKNIKLTFFDKIIKTIEKTLNNSSKKTPSHAPRSLKSIDNSSFKDINISRIQPESPIKN